MYLLGIDIGTSSIKVSVVEASTSQCIASAQFPETESAITSLEKGWAEQSPEMWWAHIQEAILKLNNTIFYYYFIFILSLYRLYIVFIYIIKK
jgi:xylulokinase